MIPLVFDTLYGAAALLGSPYWAYRLARSAKLRAIARGKLSAPPMRTSPGGAVWVHCASVGEVMLARGLVAELGRRVPGLDVLISHNTPAGGAAARRHFPQKLCFYCPADLTWLVSKALDRLRPDLLVLVELELWPNLVLLAHRRGIPVAVVNGRITPQTIGRYSLVSPLTRYVLRAVDLFAMQSDHYADLITMLGADPAKVHVTGSMKYDNVSTDDHPDADLARTLGIEASAPVIVGGCTYAGEDEALIDAYRGLLPRKPDLRLILAPRHPERLAAVEAAIVGAGLRCVRRSSLHPDRPAAENTTDAVVLIDTVGELERVYSLATVAFVGGSLIPRGGHNMMEPAGRGKPVLVGPHTGNFADTVADLLQAGGLLVVGDSVELSQQLAELVRDPVRAAEMGARARRAIIEHKGATQRTTDLLLALATSRR